MPRNAQTIAGVKAVLLECVPRPAQRKRLLEGLARVPGTRIWQAVVAALQAGCLEQEPLSVPQNGQLPKLRARLVTYSQGAPEVVVTLSRHDAEELVRDLEAAGQFIATPGFMEQGILGRLLRAVQDASPR